MCSARYLRGKSTLKLLSDWFYPLPLSLQTTLLVGGRGLSLGARRRVLLEQCEARRLGLGGDVDRGELEQHLAPQRLALVRVRVRVRVRVELGLGLG